MHIMRSFEVFFVWKSFWNNSQYAVQLKQIDTNVAPLK